MNDNLLDVVRRRRKQIADSIIELQEEDEELEVTERTLVRLSAGRARATESGNSAAPASHKDMMISVLRTATEPWFESSKALHDAVKKIHGVDIKMSSFLPYLSDLKAKGVIARDSEGKVALASRI